MIKIYYWFYESGSSCRSNRFRTRMRVYQFIILLKLLKIYKRFIDSLEIILNGSVDGLNKFSQNNATISVKLLSKDEILNRAGVKSVIYIKNVELIKDFQAEDAFIIGVFIHSQTWLNPNQTNFIRKQLQESFKDITIHLDQVNICFFNLID